MCCLLILLWAFVLFFFCVLQDIFVCIDYCNSEIGAIASFHLQKNAVDKQ